MCGLGFRSTLRFYKHQKVLMLTSLVPEQLDRKYATNIAVSSRFRTILSSAHTVIRVPSLVLKLVVLRCASSRRV